MLHPTTPLHSMSLGREPLNACIAFRVVLFLEIRGYSTQRTFIISADMLSVCVSVLVSGAPLLPLQGSAVCPPVGDVDVTGWGEIYSSRKKNEEITSKLP